MDDSFSRLASQLRRNKINKNEIKKIKREIIDGKVLNIIKTDMATKIQKHIRGFIYRKKYKIFLDQINTEMIIDYLYEKKLTRIKSDYKNIISMHILNYIEYIREEKEKINLKKKESIDKIKATMKGIIFRKNFKNQLSSLNSIKEVLEKYIIGYKIRLILRSNNIQSLLIDIANIKYSLNNIDKLNDVNNTQKEKELKTKLNKNINLFYFTFYQMKENSNWISQTKIAEPWLKKYLDILNKNKNIFVKKKSIYSNQKKIKRLKENNSNKNPENKKELRRSRDYLINSVNNNTISNEKDFILSNFETEKSNKNDNLNIKHLLSEGREKKDKSYNFNFYDSESDDLNNNNNSIQNKKNSNDEKDTNNANNNISTKDEPDSKSQSQNSNENNDKVIRCNIIKRYKSKKIDNDQKLSSNKSKSSEDKESLNIKINEYKLDDNKEDSNINMNSQKENKPSGSIKSNKNLNKYQQREERPIKPLTNINFLENDNPFGLKRESSNNFTESNKGNLINAIPKQKSLEKRQINSTRAINRNLITYNNQKKNNISELLDKDKEETVKTQEKTELSHNDDIVPVTNKYIEYDNRPVGSNKELDRNERPLGGNKGFDYQAMFGEGGEFEGDPFGGAKQFDKDNNNKERNKNKNNKVNTHNNNLTKKKPVYDARKAIEEAKLKETKEGKKEKPSAFREFLREMKKISAEEKAQHNETNNNIDKEKEKDNNPKMNKKNRNKNKEVKEKKENIKEKDKEKEINLDLDNKSKSDFQKNNITNNKNKLLTEKNEDNPLSLENNAFSDLEPKEVKDNSSILKKNKQNETKEISHRRKLHELEKAPAPILNIKGIKSRIECWSGNNDNKKTKNNLAQRDMPKSKDEKKTKNKLNKKMNDLNLPETNHNNINSSNNSCNNIPKINKNLQEKIEKYVDKKLMQLSLQIEEIDDLFNLDKYYEEKQNKMKKYLNVPYIKKDYEFIIKFTDENYNAQIEKIQVQYKELK